MAGRKMEGMKAQGEIIGGKVEEKFGEMTGSETMKEKGQSLRIGGEAKQKEIQAKQQMEAQGQRMEAQGKKLGGNVEEKFGDLTGSEKMKKEGQSLRLEGEAKDPMQKGGMNR
jgi:uncharacterized protein YjbJ (UPF0337 family)